MRTSSTVLASILVIAMVITLLIIAKYISTPRPIPSPIVSSGVVYGYLYCNNDVIIPGNSMIILYYHPHNNVSIDDVAIYMKFPVGIVLLNPDNIMIMGIYVNGNLIAFNNYSAPIPVLKNTVSGSLLQVLKTINRTMNFNINTACYVYFPVINLTSRDTIAVVIYSAVPYALPSCRISNETEESGYITEEPVIYVINITKPIHGLPQELTQGLLANAKPIITGAAPSFMIGGPSPASKKSR